MSFNSTACFAPTLSWSSRNPLYGSKCAPTFGPDAASPAFERKVGKESEPTVKRRTRSNTPSGAKGWAARDQGPLHKWASFWSTTPQTRGEKFAALPPPDLSASEELPEVSKVKPAERELRHDVDEDNRWALQHNNPKPEKLLRYQYGRNESKMIQNTATAERTKPQDVWHGGNQTDNTLMRNKNWCNLERPRRLEPCESAQRMWTPRVRPKTPAPVKLRQRGTEARVELQIPAPHERDPNNPRDQRQLQLQAFGLQSIDSKHTFPVTNVTDFGNAREYDRYSDYIRDRTTHGRCHLNPIDKFREPVTTMMEVGFQSPNPEVYEPVGGMSPSKKDLLKGLPRVSLAGGTSGRLCSPISKFIDNVLQTRPGFIPF